MTNAVKCFCKVAQHCKPYINCRLPFYKFDLKQKKISSFVFLFATKPNCRRDKTFKSEKNFNKQDFADFSIIFDYMGQIIVNNITSVAIFV